MQVAAEHAKREGVPAGIGMVKAFLDRINCTRSRSRRNAQLARAVEPHPAHAGLALCDPASGDRRPQRSTPSPSAPTSAEAWCYPHTCFSVRAAISNPFPS